MGDISDHRLSLSAIRDAAGIIDPLFLHTPQYECEPLSELLGCRLTLKVETCNPIRSFKGRGADFFVSGLHERGDDSSLVCASTGNFGQAMAYACRKHQRELIVYADLNSNPFKLERIRALGAELRLTGHDFDAAKKEAKRFSEQSGARMIEDGLIPEISEGAGTIAVELAGAGTPIDVALIPLGNGALINGMARWLKEVSPSTEVVGASSIGADAMEKSWRTRSIVERDTVDTIAEGIAVRVPVPEAVADMQGLVDEVLLVEDDSLVRAMRLLIETAGLVVEPAGAAGVAAILSNPEQFADARVATVVTGSNLTVEQIEMWLAV